MAHDVFVSHSAQDKAVADAVCAALERAAVRCWVAPRDVQPGRSFAGEITRAIQQSKAMVLIFSANSNNSQQVLREVQLAVSSHLHIVQLRIEDVRPNDDLTYFLSTPHWLDALTPPLETHLQRLVAAVKALSEPVIAPPAPASPIARPVPEPARNRMGLLVWLALALLMGIGFPVWNYYRHAERAGGSTESRPTKEIAPSPAATDIATRETIISFADVDTGSVAPFTVSAAPYLRKAGITIEKLVPPGSELILVNNRGLYEGKGVFPTVSQNFLTQVNTGNVPASFTLRLRTPAQQVTFMRPRLYPYTASGVTHPAWSARALDEQGNELSSQREGIIRRLPSRDAAGEDDVPAQTYTLRAPGFEPIVAVRFDSDPNLNGRPFAAFSTLLIERITLTPEGR
ncbi:MAG TPA: toll/interleukin-1 receptor domain-containing protein [Chthoniobacterales bacterium]|nr:toll/interleukin-1 receptor domain-containing protein [Chthoniobacterales bacterium]